MTGIIKLSLLVMGLTGAASAQTVQEIISKVDSTQKAVKDLSFRLSGNANFENQSQRIDLTLRAIPAQNVAKLQFAAPDMLADNIMLIDKNEVRQYMFLTNQITVTPLKKAAKGAGLGGLGGLDLNGLSNTADLLKRYEVKLLSTSGSAGKRVFQLEATPKSGGERSRLWITETGWRPTRMQMMKNDKVLADLSISNYRTNSGLSVASLKALPKDAQIIRH